VPPQRSSTSSSLSATSTVPGMRRGIPAPPLRPGSSRRRRAERHPTGAILILLREAELAIDNRSNATGYTRAAELLVELAELHQRAGLDFSVCLERFKAYHHRRPIATMERVRVTETRLKA
jgi:hypothetical protein